MSGAGGSIKRLQREYKNIQASPIREFLLYPMEDNMFEWHFTMMGPPDSPYEGGYYHGRILVPTNYPFAPPDVVLMTPNGRFELEKRICLSISSYHPENWHPTWGISTVLHALREFMLTPGNNAIGAIDYPDDIKRKMAIDSKDFICKDCLAKIREHIETLQSNPPATESDKKKEQAMPTPDLSAQKNPSGASQPAATPTLESKKVDDGTPTMVREMTPMTGLPPAAETTTQSLSDCVTPTPAGGKDATFPSQPNSPTDLDSDADESNALKESPQDMVEGKEEEAEAQKSESTPEKNKVEEKQQPAAPAQAVVPEPIVEPQPQPRPAAIERRQHGFEINISVGTLDRLLFFLFLMIGLLCLKKIFINYEGSMTRVQEAMRLA